MFYMIVCIFKILCYKKVKYNIKIIKKFIVVYLKGFEGRK